MFENIILKKYHLLNFYNYQNYSKQLKIICFLKKKEPVKNKLFIGMDDLTIKDNLSK